jgi:electron transfer flavoprotein beta subunit
MNIVVCIKQVPGSADIKIHPDTNTLVREGVEAVINPFDLYALEEGLRQREAHGGTLSVLSMGPPQAESALREALAMGADQAVLVSDPAFAGSDSLATSVVLAAAVRKLRPFDLVLMGRQAIDGDTGQVGPETAEQLGIPHLTEVKKIESFLDGRLTLQRLLEDGYVRLRAGLPLLLTVVKEINEPRPASFKGRLRARQASIAVWRLADLGLDAGRVGLSGSPTRVERIWSPPRPAGGRVFRGPAAQTVSELLVELEKAGVRLGSLGARL